MVSPLPLQSGRWACCASRRTMERGIKSGVFSGLGAASADTIYGTIAAAGLTLIADFLTAQQFLAGTRRRVIPAVFRVSSLWQPEPPEKEAQVNETAQGSLIKDFFSTLALTLSNPITIFSFIAIFSGFQRFIGFDLLFFCIHPCFGRLLWFSLMVADLEYRGKLLTPAYDG